MATLDDVAELALALDGVTEGERHGRRSWSVGDKVFTWERPFSKADLKRFGERTPPLLPVIAVAVADLHEKEAVLAENRKGIFTIEHFAGFPAVLVELRLVRKPALREILLDGWLACAPPELTKRFRTS